MLGRIEAALRARQTWTAGELARHLGMEPELVLAAIDQLGRMGRLPESAVLRIEGRLPPCAGCAFAPDCGRAP